MLASVEGTVGAVTFDSVVIEVGGLGYRVFAAPAILASAQPGKVLKLHTFHLVREALVREKAVERAAKRAAKRTAS